ncbi:hypothetical protein C8R45DRAFT_599221 [Mycena sanguinolenta]|nr:hypothetical protein C8R45DRAFT_599221 [Mycena sanguinolenta]
MRVRGEGALRVLVVVRSRSVRDGEAVSLDGKWLGGSSFPSAKGDEDGRGTRGFRLRIRVWIMRIHRQSAARCTWTQTPLTHSQTGLRSNIDSRLPTALARVAFALPRSSSNGRERRLGPWLGSQRVIGYGRVPGRSTRDREALSGIDRRVAAGWVDEYSGTEEGCRLSVRRTRRGAEDEDGDRKPRRSRALSESNPSLVLFQIRIQTLLPFSPAAPESDLSRPSIIPVDVYSSARFLMRYRVSGCGIGWMEYSGTEEGCWLSVWRTRRGAEDEDGDTEDGDRKTRHSRAEAHSPNQIQALSSFKFGFRLSCLFSPAASESDLSIVPLNHTGRRLLSPPLPGAIPGVRLRGWVDEYSGTEGVPALGLAYSPIPS